MYTKDDLVAAARELAERMGTRSLAVATFCRETGIERRYVRHLFGNWTALCNAAGLEPTWWKLRVPDEEIFAAMRETFIAAGGITTRTHFERGFRYSENLLTRRFRTWHAALSAFRAWVAAHDPDFPHMDRLDTRLAEGDKAPPPALPPSGPRAWPSTGGPVYGEPLGFRALLHAPLNEAGVMLVFGALAGELGFLVETVQGAFPDCVAKRRVGPRHWERVRIEFEYKSRAFRDHGHDPAGCDLIVCWEHDWPECPVEVLELRAAAAALRGGGAAA